MPCAHVWQVAIDGTNMYETYWKLHSTPFGPPNGDGWYYESPSHEEAEARLHFLIDHRRACGLMTGPAGTGKTTLFHRLAAHVRRAQRHPLLLDLCGMTDEEFIWQFADALHLGPATSTRPFLLWRRVQDHLLGLSRAEQHTVMLFDHTTGHCDRSLEQLLHLVEQSDRWCTLLIAVDNHSPAAVPGGLEPRADLKIDLAPLNRQETTYYVYESLRRAGADTELFEPQAYDALFVITGGILRDINRVCELSLLAGMADSQHIIDAETVTQAADNRPHAARSLAPPAESVIA